MKKIILCAVIIIIGLWYSHAISLEQQTQIKQLISLIEQKKPDTESRLQTLQSLYNMLAIAYQKTDINNRPIIEFAKKYIADRIAKKHNTWELRYPETIQDWLNKHNTVRKTPLQAHPLLMQTAQKRADYLSQNNIQSNTHRRIHGNYNYTDIENWFYQQGVTFENKERVTFSESIAYGTVRCETDQCDQKLKQETEKSWNFLYTQELPRNWPHYRAIVEENFQYIGIGIAVNNGRYHIVIHYGTDIQEPVQISRN